VFPFQAQSFCLMLLPQTDVMSFHSLSTMGLILLTYKMSFDGRHVIEKAVLSK